jgi:ribonuclease BN (tRNA processing enzyme)
MTFNAEILPLGTRAGILDAPHQKATCYLLKLKNLYPNDKTESIEHQILFDVGTQRVKSSQYIDYKNLDLLFLSHGHLDHTLHLGSLLRMLKRKKRIRPLFVFCHENAWRPLKWWIRLWCGTIPKFVKLISLGLTIDNPYLKTHEKKSSTDYSQITHLEPIRLDDDFLVKISVAPAMHSNSSVAYRLKISSLDKKSDSNKELDLIFSPDTSYQSNYLVPFAKDAQYWLLDSGFQKDVIDEYYEMYLKHEKGGEIVCHSSPYHSGKICEAASVKNYVVVHYVWPRYTDKFENVEENMISRIRPVYNGNIIVSFDLKPIQLVLSDIR